MILEVLIPIAGWAATISVWRWSRAQAYREGVWDGTHNPHIPPVQRALAELQQRGWQP